MRNSLLAVIFSLFYWSRGISADDDIKRGTFRFMGFIYYQDETVYDRNGARFMQGAVLIRQNFLISSTLTSSISMDPLSKTLLARVGAVRIDPSFTFNEDEDEQEQEIVQIMKPISNRTMWWAADISLLMTLLPFKTTSTVQITQLSIRRDYTDKICNIIVFKKKNSRPDGTRYLTPLSVEMVPSTPANCGSQFDEQTMACAVDPQGSSVEDRSDDFCEGNSGGPLICDNDVMALQTYIQGNCHPPHLYQLLAPWKKFLACGTGNHCGDNERCPNVCSVIQKDSPVTLPSSIKVQVTTKSTSETVATEQNTTKTMATERTMTETMATEQTTTETIASEGTTTETMATEISRTELVTTESTTEKTEATKDASDAAKRQRTKTTATPVVTENASPAKKFPKTLQSPDKKEEEPKKRNETLIMTQRFKPVKKSTSDSSSAINVIPLCGLIFNGLIACVYFM